MKTEATTVDAYKLFHDGILALSQSEQYGTKINVAYCKKMISVLEKRITRHQEKFMDTKLGRRWAHSTKKINIFSDQQLSIFLFKTMKLTPTDFTDNGNPATDHEALENLGLDDLIPLAEAKKWRKAKSTYFEPLVREQVMGIVHANNNLHLAKSYRSSMDHVNFQNQPKRDEKLKSDIRKAIIPRKGHQLVEIDYGGIEVCMSCCNHKDQTMIDYVKDPSTDMHKDMAIQLYKLTSLDKHHSNEKNLRNGGKNGFVFPQFYGDYWRACARNLWKWKEGVVLKNGMKINNHLKAQGIGTLKRFEKHVKDVEKDFWEVRFQKYNRWKDKVYSRYQKTGVVKLLSGFECKGVMSKKQVCNVPMQGLAFHCLLWSYIELTKRMIKEKWESRLLFQVHDAIVFDMAPGERDYVIQTSKEIMCKELLKAWEWIIVPLTVDVDIAGIDEPWSMMKEYKG